MKRIIILVVLMVWSITFTLESKLGRISRDRTRRKIRSCYI